MTALHLIGIGTGNPDHLTLQAVKALNMADLVMIPRKGADKADLADLRRTICAEVIRNPGVRFAEFDLPGRDLSLEYLTGVEAWHDAIAEVWRGTIASHGNPAHVALLVWGDPSLYDSTLRIAARLGLPVHVVPGITSVQGLTAAHGIALNEIGAPVTITTGRQLADHGWPVGAETLVIMLDGKCSFQRLDPTGISIWWGAFVGMADQILLSGALSEVGPAIIAEREAARHRHGWIMDIYLLRR